MSAKVQNCDNQVGTGGTQGGNFVNSTLHNPVFHIHTPGRSQLEESSLLETDPRRWPSDEENLLRLDDKRKKGREEIEVRNQRENLDSHPEPSLCIREQKRIRILILIFLPQILIIIIVIIYIIIDKSRP